MDAIVLQNKIAGDKDSVLQVLESLGYEHISDRGNYLSFPRLDGDNPQANVIYVDSLKWNCYTRSESGNLFTLVMNTRDCSLPKALKYIINVLDIKDTNIKISAPFHGFYKSLTRSYIHTMDDDVVYDESILEEYGGLSKKFFDDGVDYLTQERFEVCFNHKDNAIGIPIRNFRGDLIGVKMRNNDPNSENRFWSAYNYYKTGVVYGLYQNYEEIIKHNCVIICEAEKSVMQAASFGLDCVVAIGGHDISPSQAQLIKSLMVKKIIIAFDEGVGNEETKEQCRKLLVNTTIYKSNVYYLFDKEHEYLAKGSKDSPFDNGKEVFQSLLKNKRKVEE